MAEGSDEVLLGPGSFPWRDVKCKVDAVCHLALVNSASGSASATGFLAVCQIKGQLETFVLCNHHFVQTIQDALKVKATFLFDDSSTPVVVRLDPDGFFLTDDKLDYTLVRVQERDLDLLINCYKVSPIKLKNDKHRINVGDVISIPQHPNGKQKKLSWDKVVNIGENYVCYSADTDKGSSGSPVFCGVKNNLEILALHKAGGATLPNGELANKGILISSIVEHINHHGRDKKTRPRTSAKDESGMFVNNGNATTTTSQGHPVVHPQLSGDAGLPCEKDPPSISNATENIDSKPIQPIQETPLRCCEKDFTSKELIKLAQRINAHWNEVALLTKRFENWEITNIVLNNNFHNPILKANEMLQKYKSRVGTRECLADALDSVKLIEEANIVRQGSFME